MTKTVSFVFLFNWIHKLFLKLRGNYRNNFCQTPLQHANITQLQSVGVGVDFVFPMEEEEGRKEEEGITLD